QRTAINLGGVEVSNIERGMVLAPAARLRPTQIIDAQIEVLQDAPRPLRSRARVRVHVGAAEVLARVQVLTGDGEIAPGASGFAQLRLEAPVVALPDERFIIRSYSPSHTIAGGRVLDAFATKHRGREREQARARLQLLTEAEPAQRLAIYVAAAGEQWLRRADLAARTGWRDEVLDRVVAEMKKLGDVREAEGVFIAAEVFTRLMRAALEAVQAHHRREPLQRGLARETLRERVFAHVPPEIFRAVLQQAESAGTLVAERDVVRAATHSLELAPADAALRDRLEAIYAEARLEAPTLDEALARAGNGQATREHGRKLIQLLLDAGTLVRVTGELFFHRAALDRLIRDLRAYAAAHEPERLIDVAAFKDLAHVSRKYAIPLLEYLDRERITRRAGDRRKIL
ncbi:MAG TPA: SelB C-terminal domain-containing protein, partial [Pyrinomonadaceae bacterium]|nr:SelB C-terminal domain-containing protein [Pyrinomonadaceae bacterium]